MNEAASFVGTVPDFYERFLGPVMFHGPAERMAQKVAAFNPGNVLETAAGTGIVTRAMLAALPGDVRITVTDLSQDMVDCAARQIGSDNRVSFRQSDAQSLTAPDNEFDCMVCQFGVMFYSDKDAGFREALRVLKPGGRYLLSFWDGPEFNAFARVRTAYLRTILGDALPPHILAPFSYSFDAAKAGLLSVGFEAIEASVIRLQTEISDAEQFARGHIQGTSATKVFQEMGLDQEKATRELAATFRQELGEAPCRTTLQAILVSARKPEMAG